jgi:hypothetical protein
VTPIKKVEEPQAKAQAKGHKMPFSLGFMRYIRWISAIQCTLNDGLHKPACLICFCMGIHQDRNYLCPKQGKSSLWLL